MDPERVLPGLASTGDPLVDAAVERLAALDDLGLDERPAVLASVHDRLREILGELGAGARTAPGAPAVPGGLAAPARPGEPGRPGAQGELGGRR